MNRFRKHLFSALLIGGLASPVAAQFQNVYSYKYNSTTYHSGTIKDVTTLNPGGSLGTGVLGGNQIAAIGTDYQDSISVGLLSWYDDLGNKILYRPITNVGPDSTWRDVEGVDLCEATWNNSTQVSLLKNDDRAILIYTKKIGYLKDFMRKIPDFDPQALIAANTSQGHVVVALGLDNSSNIPRLAVTALNASGTTVWSFRYDLLNVDGDPLTAVRGYDIEYLDNQGFVVVGSARDPLVNRECAWVLNLADDGTIIPDNPLTGTKGLHIYHTNAIGRPLWLSGKTVTPTFATPGFTTEVIIGGEYRTNANAINSMYVMRINPLTGARIWDQTPKSGSGLFSGIYNVEDMDYNGGEFYQLTGFIENSRNRGFTYHFAFDGATIGYYEYDGSSLPSDHSRLLGNCYDPEQSRFVMGGAYDITSSLPSSIDDFHWLIGTQSFLNGQALNCTHADVPQIPEPNIVAVDGFANASNGNNASNVNMKYGSKASMEEPQCVTPKRNSIAPADGLENALTPSITHLSDIPAFQVEVTGEMDGPMQVRVQNLQGQILWQGELDGQQTQISTLSYPAGIYLLSWEFADGTAGSKKIPVLK